MAGQHLSLTALTLLLAVSGVLFYGVTVLYGKWSSRLGEDLHPTTAETGHGHAQEDSDDA